ncbi:MAG: GNAT family N-acetyltransferase [Vagococcus sp.]
MIRFAKPEDASQAMDLVMIVLKDMELDIFNKLSEEKVKELLVQAYIEEPDYRYGYNNAIIKEVNNEVAGVVFGYPNEREKTIDDAFVAFLIKNDLTEEYRLFHDLETFENEWYLDTIVTSPTHRGKGIASELINALPELAKKHNKSIIGLNVDKINDNARKVYLKNGFVQVGEIEIAHHDYDHLQKDIS